MTERQHAVVIGASMAGLLAARVLSDSFARVTLLDRDELPDAVGDRRGVPQGRHAHLLLPGGRLALEELFPGLVGELEGQGAPVARNLDEFHFEPLGRLLRQDHEEQPDPLLKSLQASRPLLEGSVRARVRQISNVELRDGFAVRSPLIDPTRRRVLGVQGVPTAGGPDEMLVADLVVDATGRAGRAPGWLKDWGYPPPPVEEIRVHVGYASQLVRLPADPRLKKLYVIGMHPGRPLGLALFSHEKDTWMFTVVAVGDNQVPADRQSMIDAVMGFAPPELRDGLPASVALSEPVAYGYPSARRLRYDKVRRFPQGFLVMGDASCSLNPTYGQGMTVAAFEAHALRKALEGDDARLARRFFKRAARPSGVAWQLSTGSDLALPEVEGSLTLQMRIGNAWLQRVLRAAEVDGAVAAEFLRVAGMLHQPTALLRPGVVARVVRPRRSAEQVAKPEPVLS